MGPHGRSDHTQTNESALASEQQERNARARVRGARTVTERDRASGSADAAAPGSQCITAAHRDGGRSCDIATVAPV